VEIEARQIQLRALGRLVENVEPAPDPVHELTRHPGGLPLSEHFLEALVAETPYHGATVTESVTILNTERRDTTRLPNRESCNSGDGRRRPAFAPALAIARAEIVANSGLYGVGFRW